MLVNLAPGVTFIHRTQKWKSGE